MVAIKVVDEMAEELGSDEREPRPKKENAQPAPLHSRFRRSHAIVIGVDGYSGGVPPLRNAVRDALQVGRALGVDHHFEVTAFFDERAARQAVLDHLRDVMAPQINNRDRLVVYVAAHGYSLPSDSGPDGFLLLHDARRGDAKTFLPMRELYQALAALACPHVLVILDCCFAGAFRWATARDVGARMVFRETFDRFVESPAWQALTSAAADQLAFDSFSGRAGEADQHSPFAAALLRALRGSADQNGDGLVTATDLYQYVRDQIELALLPHPQRQTPGLFPLPAHGHGEFVFAVPGRPLQLPRAEELTEDRNPYLGLASFEETRADDFFGRAPAIRALQQKVQQHQLVVVTGPSGTGKSSLVQAGLLPALRAQKWRILPPRRPGLAPLTTLSGLASELSGTKDGADRQGAVAALERSERPVLLVIDQLEELATLQGDPKQARQFLETLAAALQGAPELHLVVTVRADLEPRLETGPLSKLWSAGRFAIAPMTSTELRDAIEGPAHRLGMYFDPPSIVDRLLEDVLTSPTPLPLLSFALHEMYRARQPRRDLDRAFLEQDYAAIGSVRSALARRASAVHDSLTSEDGYAVTLRNVMLRMVTPIGAELARRRVSRQDLDFGDEAENTRVERVLEELRGARLISLAIEEATGGHPAVPYAEPAHDELVRGWGTLSQWWQAALPLRGVLDAVGFAAHAWQANARATSYLWARDPRLAQVVALADGAEPVLNRQELAFVRASARRRTSTGRKLAAVVTMVIAALATAAIVAWVQRQHARDTLGVSLAEQGRRFVVEGQPRRALPFLARARELGASSTPLRQLFALATRELWTVEVRHGHGGINAATYSADGKWFATTGFDGTARVWDVATGAPVSPPLPHGGTVHGVRFLPDGARLVTTGADDRAQIWEWRSGAAGAALWHCGWVRRAEPSPDGRWIITISDDDTAQVWNAATGKPVGEPLRHGKDVRSAAFSPDATLVATASDDGTARLWNVTTGHLHLQTAPQEAGVVLVRWSPAGDRVLTVDNHSLVRVWTAALEEVTLLKNQPQIIDARFSPDGKRVVTTSHDGYAELWDAASGAPMLPAMAHRDRVLTTAFSSDGGVLATGSYDGAARLWDATTGLPLTPPLEHGDAVETVELSPDGASLLTSSGDGAARIWPVAGGRPVAVPSTMKLSSGAVMSPDGRERITIRGRFLWRWSLPLGTPLGPPLVHGDTVDHVSFSASGNHIVAIEGTEVAVWSRLGTRLGSFAHRGLIKRAELDGQERRLVSASWDNTARLWSLATKSAIGLPLQHNQVVEDAQWSRDGTRVVTASSDRTSQVWDASTGQRLTPPLEHENGVSRAKFSLDGERVITTDSKGTAFLWELPLDRRTEAQWRAIADRYGLGAVPGQEEPGPEAAKGPLIAAPSFTPAQQRARAANLLASAARLAHWQPAIARGFALEARDLSQTLQDEEGVTRARTLLSELGEALGR
jgi:WD40 repeat protein